VESDVVVDIHLAHVGLFRLRRDHVDGAGTVVVYRGSGNGRTSQELLLGYARRQSVSRIHRPALRALHLCEGLWRKVVGQDVAGVVVESEV
jgi:hypothetical protein